MARAFSRREWNVVITGGIFLVCFLMYWFVLVPQREELASLQAAVGAKEDDYKEIQKIEAQYNLLKRESDPIVRRILQRRKDFDLSAFVAETENKQNFTRDRAFPPDKTTYGKFEKNTCRFRYKDKALHQIVAFLKEIEKPENVVTVELLTINPSSTSDPSRLGLEIRLATVVPVK